MICFYGNVDLTWVFNNRQKVPDCGKYAYLLCIYTMFESFMLGWAFYSFYKFTNIYDY